MKDHYTTFAGYNAWANRRLYDAATALAKVRDDKTRESGDGFDGSWVAHPDLVPLCKEVFDAALGGSSRALRTTPIRTSAASLHSDRSLRTITGTSCDGAML